MAQKILIFILFLGPLVFFHELGHYLFARLFGVRVEVFSIGFGPKILKFKKGFTQYAVSLIPLGGYVKMFGDDPFNSDSVAEEDKKYSYVHKSKWARFWIVFGGPLANFILAYVIYVALFMSGEKVPEIKLGAVSVESQLHKYGFRTGDSIKKVNGQVVAAPTDIALNTENTLKSFEVGRLGKNVRIDIPSEFSLKPEIFFEEMAKSPAVLIMPVLKSKSGDFYLLSDSKSEAKVEYSLEELSMKEGKEYYLYKLISDELKDEKPVVDLSVEPKPFMIDEEKGFYKTLVTNDLYPVDIVVGGVTMGSPAANSGLQKGDIIKSIEGKELMTFNELKEAVSKYDGKALDVVIIKNGEEKLLKLSPEVKENNGEKQKLIGVYAYREFYMRPKFVEIPSLGIISAFTQSFGRTGDAILKTFEGFKKLITAETSFKNIGGPLSIGKVASDSLSISASYFFQLMALISINLGVINLFPIPVLDGGHIVFIILEAINGGPLSRRKLEVAQQFGFSLLLLLMVGALFNDFTRFF